MTVSSAYHHLAARHETLLGSVTERVKEAVAIESLYLLGLTHTQHSTETLFAAAPATRCEVAHGWLLTVVNEEGHHVNNVSDKLETRLLPLVQSTVIVLSAAAFIQWFAEAHPFALAVYCNGYLLYGAEGLTLPALPAVDEERRRREAERLFVQAGRKVREFLAGAELYTLRMQYGLAAFLLHQAAEQCLSTLLVVHTGLRLNTHSLPRLLRCCFLFCSEPSDVFPQMTEKDRRLLALLQQAYVDARYKEDYRIKSVELTALAERVKELEKIFLRCRP